MTQKKKIRVFIVDDHPIVRDGLAQLISQQEDLMVCGQAGDAATALKDLNEADPDVAIVDIALKGMSGLQLVKTIAARRKKLAVLVLSMYDERVYAERALRAGAKGYIMKEEGTRHVVTAIHRIMAGQTYLSENLVAQMMNKLVGSKTESSSSPVEVLSDRELEVFRLIGDGFKTHEISEKLNLSVKTIETYRQHIKEKLNLETATELIRHAIEWVHGEHAE